MNAIAEVTQPWGTIETWEEPRDASWPTLVATALTLVALLVALITTLDGWRYVVPDFGRPPVGRGPVEVPAAPLQPEPEQSPTLTYFIVASADQAALARELVAMVAADFAHGPSTSPASDWLVRQVVTPEDEYAVLAEVSLATEMWALQGGLVGVVDLR